MKCVSYDYDFENDLVTKWQALDHTTPQPSVGTKRRWRRRQLPTTDDSEDEDGIVAGRPRDHLSRKARCKKSDLQGDSASVVTPDSSDEDEEDLYHDADVGDLDFSEY